MTTSAISTSQATLCQLFARTASERAEEIALRSVDGNVQLTWGDCDQQSRAAAGSLAGLGVGPGDTVACWLGNRPEFHVVDVAALGLGAAPFSVYPTFTVAQAEHGVPVGEVYGMSESTGVATVNPPAAIRIGTTGTPLDGVGVQLSEQGEILIRGPVVMPGCRSSPEKTAEATDDDGWLHAGDGGVFDAEHYLRIVDRIKELIINAAGTNMSPANIEGTVKTAGGLIGHVCAIGDGRPYNTALITLDPDGIRAFAVQHELDHLSLDELAADERVEAEVAAQIERANERLARVEQIKNYVLLAEDSVPDGDELTPTMKLKRKPIAAKYAIEIDGMYGAR